MKAICNFFAAIGIIGIMAAEGDTFTASLVIKVASLAIFITAEAILEKIKAKEAE